MLYKFANKNMVLEKLYEEVSSLVLEKEFSDLYDYATKEPHNALVIDTHPLTKRGEARRSKTKKESEASCKRGKQ